MRVIAGSARRTQLKTLEGMDTRPTTDRIKETLFNMIAPYLYDSIFLDLFAGSGGIGIEALSRGAMEAVFVEKNPKAMACVKENLQKTHFERKGMTMQMDVMTALYKLEGEKQFDYIFMDIMMPIKNGLEATREIRVLPRRDAKSVHILAMSANAFESDIQECIKAGMDGHIAKPITMELLKEKLAK